MTWKVATVTALHKKGDRYAPNSYHPVGLTSVVSKMLETTNVKFLLHFDQNDLYQHDFQSGHLCVTQFLKTGFVMLLPLLLCVTTN